MEQITDILTTIDLISHPAFCVKDQKIVKTNPGAARLQITPGTDVRSLILTGTEEYSDFKKGCLTLSLSLDGKILSASVIMIRDICLFCLEDTEEREELNVLALAAQKLRDPLQGIMISAEKIISRLPEDLDLAQAAWSLEHNLYRALRITGNMADAGQPARQPHLDPQNAVPVINEIMQKAAELLEHAGISLSYQAFLEKGPALVDYDILERSILNLISNAAKYTPKGGCIKVTLKCRSEKLCLNVQNPGTDIDESAITDPFSRYFRTVGLESPRRGIGLGMMLARSGALAHGGTLLMSRTPEGNVEALLTIPLLKQNNTETKNPILRPDYTGGLDAALIELSDVLPAELYDLSLL